MKIQVLSDLHLEFVPLQIPATNADLVVLAGDIHVGTKGVTWALANIPNKPVVYVLGNHEYYGSAYPKLLDKLKDLSTGTNLHVLENDQLHLDGVTILGCTLWTDFRLFDDVQHAAYEASQKMTDFRKIRVSPNYSRLKPHEVVFIHRKSIDWLKAALSQDHSGQVVVVTHHAPSRKSIPERYAKDALSAAYASNLDELVATSNASLWIHGHVHDQLDYQLGSTRVICNPRGYPDELNRSFNPEFVITVQ